MSAHGRGRSVWHLNRSSLWAIGLAWMLVGALTGCPGTEPAEGEAQQPAAPRTGAEIRRQVNVIYERKGEDAYMDPALDPMLIELEALARAGDKDAATLRGLILAKRRLALRAQSGERRPPDPNLVRRGKLVMAGPAPQTDDRIALAEAITLGSRRQDLKDAYGSCLIRQTWFPATRPGGVTTELFHVAPDCREKLKPRIFRVAKGEVQQVEEGDLDGVMEDSSTPATEG